MWRVAIGKGVLPLVGQSCHMYHSPVNAGLWSSVSVGTGFASCLLGQCRVITPPRRARAVERVSFLGWPGFVDAGLTFDGACWVSHAPEKYPECLLYVETLARCWFNSGSVFVTLFRHWFSIVSVPPFILNADFILLHCFCDIRPTRVLTIICFSMNVWIVLLILHVKHLYNVF